MSQNETGTKLTIQNVVSAISAIVGIVGTCFGVYFYIDKNYVSVESHDHYKKINKVRLIEMDLREAEHELSHYSEIPEDDLTTAQKHQIEVLTKKTAFLEENLPWE